ncbi:pitrilysin family protein [Salegentibacter sp. Hel_I_6]|uniref:M16 family metallopeptidase n=1 Tax=Salegentibacter sp. Hel_I_6 TaxID=1250278 RepID=UPI000561313E|nr:insulinase family protein [Salegentibacter sp. Hel_I_6]
MKKLLLNSLILFLAVNVGLQAQESENIPVSPKVKMGKLDNGLTYYIRNNERPEDKLELRLVINAGSILENEDQQGLAHFVEHMNFNGTENFEKNELVDYLQSIGVKFGADLNAYTSFDETVYILPIPSDDEETLNTGFQILEDWAHKATMTDEDIDEERGVVMEEYRLGLGPDKRMMQEYLPKVMYNSHYADRLPIGKKEVIQEADYETIRNFYKDWYRPDLMAVVAVGDLDVETIEKKIKEHFSNLKPVENPRERKTYDLPNHEETFVSIASDEEAPFSQVRVYYKDHEESEDVVTKQDYIDQMEKSLFSTMINNRLSELTNSSNPPFNYGYSYYGGTFARNKNAYQSFAMTGEDQQLESLKALLEENERVKRHGFTESEFKRAKSEYLARLEQQYKDRDKQESGRLVSQYVSHFLENSPIPGTEWRYNFAQENLEGIDLNEINGLISEFLHEDNRVIVLTGPKKEGLEPVKEEEVMALLDEIKSSEIASYEEEALRDELITKMPNAGSVVETETNDEVGFTRLKLSNGAEVVYKKTDFKNDEILFSAKSMGGTSLYSDEDYLNTSLANSGLSQAGIADLSVNDLNKMMSGKIVQVRPDISSYTEGFSGSSTPKDLETLFQMVHLYFTDLNKDEEAYTAFVNKQKAFLGNLMSNPNFYFQNELGKFRNEGNSRYVGFPTPEKYDSQDYDLAYKKYQERFANAGDFTFYFVGNIDEDKVKQFASIYIASLPSSEEKEEFKVPEFRTATSGDKKVVYKGTDPKSMVNILWNGETNYKAEEDFTMKALGEILTIKLVEQLREEEAGVYGVGARGNLSKIPYGSYSFNISFPCGPENVESLTEAALAEVEKIKENGPTDKDLEKIKETFLVQRKDQLQENRFWLSQLETADMEEREIDEILKYEEKVAALSKEEIKEVANKYLNENYLLGVLMPEKTDGEAVEAGE